MTMIRCHLRLGRQAFILLISSLLALGSAWADPAGRVGRVAWLSGSVHVHRAESGESSTLERNWPVSSGDLLSTASGARAEVQIGSAVLRLDSNSVLEFVKLDDHGAFLRLLDGSFFIRLPFPESAREYELAILDNRFQVRDAGLYRFDAGRRSSAATAYSGRLRRTSGERTLDIDAGQRVAFWDGGASGYRIAAPEEDEFASWHTARERQFNAQVVPYVSNEMTGAADLAAYGSWSEHAEYGAIWYPRTVPAGWAPYRSGRWIWVDPWGWTWVADEPWGFAPFHYGRWIFLHGAWGWVPGRWVARPVYAPALVAWVGAPDGGRRFGTRPAIGWFPLAPREVYVPSYRASEEHFRQINGGHVTRLPPLSAITRQPQAFTEHARYAYRAVPHAVTTAHSEAFAERRHVGDAVLGQQERSDVLRGQVHVRPPVATPGHEAASRRIERDPAWPARTSPTGSGRAIDERPSERRTPQAEPLEPPLSRSPSAAQAPTAPVVHSPPPAIPSGLPPAVVNRQGEPPRHQPGAPSAAPGTADRAEQNPGRSSVPATPSPATLPRPPTPASGERPPVDAGRPSTATRDRGELRPDRRDEPRGSSISIPPAPAVAHRPVERAPTDFVRPANTPRPERLGDHGERHGQERRRAPAEREDQRDDSIRRQTH